MLGGVGVRTVASPGGTLDRRFLAGVVRTERFDVAHLYTGGFPPDATVSARLISAGVPVIESLHALTRRHRVHVTKRLRYRFLSSRRHRILVMGRAMHEQCFALLPELASRAEFIRFGMRLPGGDGLPARPDGVVRLVQLGRLDESHKDVGTLLDACARLGSAGVAGWTLDLVGDGPDRGRLQAYAGRLGLNDRVRFLGWVEDVRGVLAGAHVSVLSTKRESFGRVNVEAAALGCAVVASDVAGCRDSVSNGENGVLVRPGDAGALAEVLGALIADSSECARLGVNGPTFAAWFDIGAHAARFESLAASLAGARSLDG